jgi:hypothetical protein
VAHHFTQAPLFRCVTVMRLFFCDALQQGERFPRLLCKDIANVTTGDLVDIVEVLVSSFASIRSRTHLSLRSLARAGASPALLSAQDPLQLIAIIPVSREARRHRRAPGRARALRKCAAARDHGVALVPLRINSSTPRAMTGGRASSVLVSTMTVRLSRRLCMNRALNPGKVPP